VVQEEEGGKLGLYAKPGGMRCPNLVFDKEDKASCKIHDRPWYKQTPCYVYQNSALDPDFTLKRGKPCMLGPMLAKAYRMPEYGEAPRELERFEDFEPVCPGEDDERRA
jgi:hypothetical protein